MSFALQLFQFFVSGLTTGSTYALIAIGFSIIHNASGIVNFAQGEFVMLGGYVHGDLSQRAQTPLGGSLFSCRLLCGNHRTAPLLLSAFR